MKQSKIDSIIKHVTSLTTKPTSLEWYQIGKKYKVKSPNKQRAKTDTAYAMSSIRKKTQDIWRTHLGVKNIKRNTKNKIVKAKMVKARAEAILERKRLFYDIETSYNIGKFWRTGYNLNINPGDIIRERAIICVSWKWEGDSEVHSLEWDQGDDKKLITQFVPILESADEIVGHNVDRFDTKWIATRALYHGIPMSHNIKSIDTLKIAKKYFNFNSNKLDYIADYLGLGHKLKHRGMPMWDDIILRNDAKALIEMVDYCEKDVTLTEEVFAKLKPYSAHKLHYGALKTEDKHSCPECGDKHITHVKNTTTKMGTLRYHVRCNSCKTGFDVSESAYHKGTYIITD